MAKRESKLTAALKWQIRWLVGRVHVAETDAEVAKMMPLRMDAAKFTPGCIKAATAYALKCHHDNQGLVKKWGL